MDIKYPVSCPLMNHEKIDMDTCFDIHMVVCGKRPNGRLPLRFMTIPIMCRSVTPALIIGTTDSAVK